tara:strand:- start:16048 stop:16785 length:738 start_codon:yes stop_codon:yes gene_type:complete
MLAFYRNKLVTDPEAFQVFTREWAYLDGFFETMLLRDGEVVDLEQHMQRLESSLKKHNASVDIAKVKEELSLILEEHDIPKNWALRLMIFQGEAYFLFRPFQQKSQYSLLSYDFSDVMYPYGHKSMLYQDFLDAKEWALARGGDAALLYENDIVLEADHANLIFLDAKGELVCPASPKALPGIVLQHLKEKKVVKPREIKLSEIASYQAVFLCNSLLRVKPVVKIDAIEFGLQQEKLSLLQKACG